MKTGRGSWCRGVFGIRNTVASLAIGLGVLAGNLPAATYVPITVDTFIEKDDLLANNSNAQKLEVRNNGVGGGSSYALIYFDIPEATLQAFSQAWDSVSPVTPENPDGNVNGFGTVKAVLQLNSLNSASGNVRVLKATKDWHSNPSAANWGTWTPIPGAQQPWWLEGDPTPEDPAYKFIGIGNNQDGQVSADRPGTMQWGVTLYHTNQAVTRSVLDWARNAGVGPESNYSGRGTPGNDQQNVPNNGFVVVGGGGSNLVEIASMEYAAAQGSQYAPKLILYREPAPEDTIRVMDSSKVWDVYQPTQMTPTTNPVGFPPSVAPYYPTVPFPADQGANRWYSPDYDPTGVPGWNVNPDSNYNGTTVTVGAPITNNGGIYRQPGASVAGTNTVLDTRFLGTPDANGQTGTDANGRESNNDVNVRFGYLFRTEFDAPNAADVDIMRLNMVYSGSARVYLNGVEVLDMNFDDDRFREVDSTWGVPLEGGNEFTYVQGNGRDGGEMAEIYFDDPAFAGLLQPTGNTIAVFATTRTTFSGATDFQFGMNYIDLLYNTDLIPDESIEGDLNGDGFVGQDDLNLILGNWGQAVPPGDPLADPSGDNFIGQDDLNLVLGAWGTGTPPDVAAVPEPASVLLLGLAGVGMACFAAKRRSSGK